jgi:bifunctional UDP-N-acetylglucosamine pyrophosphorylase / glucosamine-1-phosphate N-acetyltransferase
MTMSVILAAGKGTRMKSGLPKVLHRLMGAPLLSYPLENVKALALSPSVVVVGYQSERIRAEFSGQDIHWAIQEEQRGTGHAALCGIQAVSAGGAIDGGGDALILNGDLPLLEIETLRGLLDRHQKSGAGATVLTCTMADPTGYGRIIRDPRSGLLSNIIEEKDADEATRRMREANVGTYVFKTQVFLDAYRRIRPDNRQGEYYLTDVVVEAARLGARVETHPVEDGAEIRQVNSRREMADVAAVIRRRILEAHMDGGVTIEDPLTTYIEKGVQIGQDVRILPYVYIEHGVSIAQGCEVGPFVHFRPGTVLEEGASIGNFVEIKASRIGPRSKARHLSYIGDTSVGEEVNIGAGTIVANYDGKTKSRTVVKRKAFIGSGTILVAPVTVGEEAVTGAGAVVTKNHDVADRDVVVGIPARSLRARGSPGS